MLIHIKWEKLLQIKLNKDYLLKFNEAKLKYLNPIETKS